MTWLLTGGAGYIGAHIVRALQNIGKDVVVLDDLSNGFAENVPPGVAFVQTNVLDTSAVEAALRTHEVVGVIHLAAKKAVGESVERPLWYLGLLPSRSISRSHSGTALHSHTSAALHWRS